MEWKIYVFDENESMGLNLTKEGVEAVFLQT